MNFILKPAVTRGRRSQLRALLLLLCLALKGEASLWQSSQWALLGTTTEEVGYDSNLFLSRDGPGAGFLLFEPGFIVKRLASSTSLEFSGSVAATQFFDGQGSQVDPAFSIRYAYPYREDALPLLTGTVSWIRTTFGSATVGQRISTESSHADFGGRLLWTGKVGITAEGSFESVHYPSDRFVDNQNGTLSVGLGYEPGPLTEYSLNLVSTAGTTDSPPSGAERVKYWEEGLTFRVRGELGPKITSSLYAGVAVVKYSGAFERSDTLPIGGGELGWRVTTRGRIYTGLELGVGYSPNGESVQFKSISLRYEQTIYSSWRAHIRVAPGRTNFRRETLFREDRSIGAGVGLAYEPSNRFSASVSYNFTHQKSDALSANFDRNLVTVRFTNHY